MGIIYFCNRIKRLAEIFDRHILYGRLDPAVTSAVTAAQIAAQRTLPKELPERMLPDQVLMETVDKIQRNTAAKGKT
jgi:Trm5-related predicted tRNA methylase